MKTKKATALAKEVPLQKIGKNYSLSSFLMVNKILS